jgi:pimeloyl-ACP methyl ester carboxylesterase
MRRAARRSTVGSLTALLGAGLSAFAFLRYRRDLRRARERISGRSKIVDTRCGPIEYAMSGVGPPVLVVHGAGGGFDQGLDLAEPLVHSGFRAVAMSRFGYLRTPLPADSSAAAQADAHASLLDALEIPRAAVIGVSAGAPSAMQFALRYPERTAALVLLVPAAYPFQNEQTSQGAMPKRLTAANALFLDMVLRSDLLFWLASRVARRAMTRMILATPPAVVKGASAEERARADGVVAHVLPVSLRRLGLRNDAAVTGSLPRYELERISAPTLAVSLEDDLFGTYDGARYSAEHIPRARFVGYPNGGHLWVGRQREVVAEIVGFLGGAA